MSSPEIGVTDQTGPDAKLVIYPAAPHGITDTHKEQLNRDLLEFARG
jgi:non-heme chloroperoxidase